MGTGGLSSEIKPEDGEAHQSPPSNFEAKNGGAILLLPSAPSWRSAYLIRRKDSFTFYQLETRFKLNYEYDLIEIKILHRTV
jgi:hypothetical protein